MTPEEIAALMAAAGGQDPDAPIGVPAGYVPPIRSGQGFQPGTGPPIAVGDLRAEPYMPGSDMLPASMPPERIVGLQQSLVDAGLLRGSFRVGVWDDSTRSAYRSLLGYANQLGTTDEFALRRWTATGMGQYEPPVERDPFVAEVTHPEDIKAGLRDFFRERVGSGKIDDARLDAMVRAWQGEEIGAQRATYDMQVDPDGGTVTSPRSFDAFAEEQARETNPVGFRAHQYLDKFSAVLDMLGGSGAGQ